ncbi:DNA repair protein RadC [Candidatus Thorarchaeota archaeon]|nr:MAG: DNA repair protein RadC [Candidatus Thorarchaeota archaeon]
METINYATKRYPKLNDSWVMKELNDVIDIDRVSNPAAAAHLMKSIFTKLDMQKEHFFSISVDTKNKIKSVDLISMGSLNANIAHPREIFYAAIAHRAASIITCHNHPSGDPNPSQQDVDIVKKLTEAGRIIGIEHMDHVIYGGEKWLSMKEQDLLR